MSDHDDASEESDDEKYIDVPPNWFGTPPNMDLGDELNTNFKKTKLWEAPETNAPYFSEESSGPRNLPDNVDKLSVLQLLFLLLPLELLDMIVLQTNLCYVRKCTAAGKTPSRRRLIKVNDLIVWLGLHMKMTKLWSGSQDDFFSAERVGGFDARLYMTRRKFYWIKAHLRFSDASKEPPRDSPDYDELYKLRPIIETLNMTFVKHWKGHTYLSVDEMMIAFKGKNPFHRYVPRKPHGNGTKLHAVCDGQHYWCLRFMVDDNTSRTVPEIAAEVLKDVVEPGQIIITDRWYTCKGLIRWCLHNRVGFIGTTKGNVFLGRRVLTGWGTEEAKTRERGDYETAVNGDGTVCCICWRDGSTVKLTMTAGNNTRVYIKRKKRNMGELIVTAPLNIKTFYKFFHGCDRNDQMKGPGYGVVLRFRAKKYTVKFFMGMFDMVLANVWILWVWLHPKDKKKHKKWFLDLADAMLGYGRPHGWTPGAGANPTTVIDEEHRERKFAKRPAPNHMNRRRTYDCAVCSRRNTGNSKDRKRTITGCMKCMVALCSTACRDKWHQWSEAERKRRKKRRTTLDFEVEDANTGADMTDPSDSDFIAESNASDSDSDSDFDSDDRRDAGLFGRGYDYDSDEFEDSD